MTDRGLQKLKDAAQRLSLLAQRKEDDIFDYKAGIISLDELMKRQKRVALESNDIIVKEVAPLESAGYHWQPVCIRLPNGELHRIGERFYADGEKWPPD